MAYPSSQGVQIHSDISALQGGKPAPAGMREPGGGQSAGFQMMAKLFSSLPAARPRLA